MAYETQAEYFNTTMPDWTAGICIYLHISLCSIQVSACCVSACIDCTCTVISTAIAILGDCVALHYIDIHWTHWLDDLDWQIALACCVSSMLVYLGWSVSSINQRHVVWAEF